MKPLPAVARQQGNHKPYKIVDWIRPGDLVGDTSDFFDDGMMVGLVISVRYIRDVTFAEFYERVILWPNRVSRDVLPKKATYALISRFDDA